VPVNISYQEYEGIPLQEAIIGLGRTELLIRHYKNALKIPRVYRNPHALLEEREIEEIMKEQNIIFLENEREVCLRLGNHNGIIHYINLSEEGIELCLSTSNFGSQLIIWFLDGSCNLERLYSTHIQNMLS